MSIVYFVCPLQRTFDICLLEQMENANVIIQ